MAGPTYTFDHDSSVSDFAVPKQAYLAAHLGDPARPDKNFSLIATSAIVLDVADDEDEGADHRPLRVLLLQRATKDEDGDLWEPPGGACDDEDESILHGAARELWEEAGLQAAHIWGEIGKRYFYHVTIDEKRPLVCQFNFGVRVARTVDGFLPAVKLNPAEHQRSVWATEREVRAGRTDDGKVKLTFTRDEVMKNVLEAFRKSDSWKEKGEKIVDG